MHGRPRNAPKLEDEPSSLAKAQKLRALQSQFLSNHHNRSYGKEALDVSAKLLEINPESYTAWNYRKLAVEHNIAELKSDTDSLESILDVELAVVERALRQNFKSYGAWYHRKWVLSKGHSSIDHELRLLDRLQKVDSRNFHAWNYRRFVTSSMNRSETDELNYTTDMINNNFSNYSAWHNRSILLSSLFENKVEGFLPKEKALTDEYELVHQAIFTDPDDQSGWFYYLWLLDQTVKTEAPRLVSSWPAHNSDINLARDNIFDGFCSDSGIFPIILYFSEAVEGVSSATINVDSTLCKNDDLIWKPVSENNRNIAQVWVTHVKLPGKGSHRPGSYPFEASVGNSEGIVSSNGFQYRNCSQIAFKICVQSVETELTEEQNDELISWNDENFSNQTVQFLEPSLVMSLGLIIDDDHESTTSKWQSETIANEIALFQELLSEIDCKIGKLTLARLLSARDAIMSQYRNKNSHSEVVKMYSDLKNSDSYHSSYYEDESSAVLLCQVTSNPESLLKHCSRYRNSTSTATANSICLRLNNLSLTRLGSTERLLWVQMLDLSHNELRSIEGLEALQLLSCVNLSHNKLCSFTAIAPLRLINSLEVLDISYNEIGLHSINTTRYLCPSPLSHTEETDGTICTEKYWEAFLIFKVLKLKQLNISGNAVADEEFKSFLVGFLTTLKWLDGELIHH